MNNNMNTLTREAQMNSSEQKECSAAHARFVRWIENAMNGVYTDEFEFEDDEEAGDFGTWAEDVDDE